MRTWMAPALVSAFAITLAFAGCSGSTNTGGTSSGSSGDDGGGSSGTSGSTSGSSGTSGSTSGSSGTSGSTSGSSGTSGSTSGSSGTSGTSGSSGSSGDAGGDGGLLPLLAACNNDAQCQSNACFKGGMGNYCSLRCTQANAATVCVAPEFNGVCNNQGYCKKP